MNGQMMDWDNASSIFMIHNLLIQKAFKPQHSLSHNNDFQKIHVVSNRYMQEAHL